MKNLDLINKLSNDLETINKIDFTYRDFLKIFLLGLVCSIAAVVFLGFRSDIEIKIFNPQFIMEFLFLLSLSFLSIFSAFRLSIPGKQNLSAPLICLIGYFLLLAYSFIIDLNPFLYHGHSLSCLIEIVLVSIAPSVFLFSVTRKAAPLNRNLAGFFVLLSGLTFGLLSTQLTCTDNTPIHIMAWHLIPASGVLGLGFVISKKIFKKI